MQPLSFGASNAFDALVYGHTSQATLDYLRQQTSSFGDQLSEHGRNFVNKASAAIEFFNGSAAVNFARSILNTVSTNHVPEYVKYLDNLQGMQNASLTMQRWNMANPTVRGLYLDQKVDGYFNSYVNMHGNDIGNNHYDYRRVMDGVFVIEEDDNHFYQYFDELIDGDRELTFREQSDIIHTWSAMDYVMALCNDDPTSPDGGKL